MPTDVYPCACLSVIAVLTTHGIHFPHAQRVVYDRLELRKDAEEVYVPLTYGDDDYGMDIESTYRSANNELVCKTVSSKRSFRGGLRNCTLQIPHIPHITNIPYSVALGCTDLDIECPPDGIRLYRRPLPPASAHIEWLRIGGCNETSHIP